MQASLIKLLLIPVKSSVLLIYLTSISVADASQTKSPLEGQITEHPENRSFFALHVSEGEGAKPKPYFMVGPGGPEDFLYRGERNADGTRTGDQMEILERMAAHGGNVMYFQSIRSHNGDGADDHNPFNDPSDPSSGLNSRILSQWEQWFDYMDRHDITLFFFIYDDGVHAFDSGVTGTVGKVEESYITQIVERFSHYPRLIWVVQEEFKYVGQGPGGTMEDGMRKPDDAARKAKMIRLAEIIKEKDPHGHLVGVHHNWNGWKGDSGDPCQFEGEVAVDIYVQQADVYAQKGKATPQRMYEEVKGAFRWNEYPVIMGEAYNLHKIALREGNRELVRQANWACVMGGAAGLSVLGTWESGGAVPSDEVLADMRRIEDFVEGIEYHALRPSEESKPDSNFWLLRNDENTRFLYYTMDASIELPLNKAVPGKYRLRWLDPIDGSGSKKTHEIKGTANFARPAHIEKEAVLYLELIK